MILSFLNHFCSLQSECCTNLIYFEKPRFIFFEMISIHYKVIVFLI